MTDTPGPFRRYLCGVMYVAAGVAMASAGAMGLYADTPGALLILLGGLAVAIAGSAVIRECRRQGHLDANVGTPVPAVERPTATSQRSCGEPLTAADFGAFRIGRDRIPVAQVCLPSRFLDTFGPE
jgi:hypothetical protein